MVNSALPWSVGLIFDIFPVLLFLHVTLAFPTGRLRLGGNGRSWPPRTRRLGLQVAKALLGTGGPDNLLGRDDGSLTSEHDRATSSL